MSTRRWCAAVPAATARGEEAIRFALLNAGFTVRDADLTFTLHLDGLDDGAAWLGRRKREFRRAVRQADPEAFTFGDARDWHEAFSVLQDNRADHGRTLSIDLDRVLAVRETFG